MTWPRPRPRATPPPARGHAPVQPGRSDTTVARQLRRPVGHLRRLAASYDSTNGSPADRFDEAGYGSAHGTHQGSGRGRHGSGSGSDSRSPTHSPGRDCTSCSPTSRRTHSPLPRRRSVRTASTPWRFARTSAARPPCRSWPVDDRPLRRRPRGLQQRRRGGKGDPGSDRSQLGMGHGRQLLGSRARRPRLPPHLLTRRAHRQHRLDRRSVPGLRGALRRQQARRRRADRGPLQQH